MIKNRKGFTLLEILTAVAILGLLMTVAIAGYSKYVEKAKKRYYQKQEELLVQAGRDYFNDNRNTLPRAPGETNCVKLKVLLDGRYIDKVVDYKQKACNDVDSRVCVTKLNNTKYLYHGELNCFTAYTSPDYKTPIVTLSPKQGENITKEKNEVETVVATINYDSKTETDKEESDLTSYRYVIYRKVDTKYVIEYDSHWVTITKPVRSKKVNIELNSTGIFYVEVWAYNIKGKLGHSKSGKVTLDMDLNCEIGSGIKVSNSNSYKFGNWTNKDVTTTFNISGGMTKYTLILLDKDNKTIYTKEVKVPPKESTNKITTEGIFKYKIIGYNNEGETCEGTTGQIKIDKTAPICTVTSDTSNWTSGKVTLTANCQDEASGCVQETRKHEVTTSTTSSYKFEGIYDKASNKGDCNTVEIKIDNNGPTINVVGYLMKKNSGGSFSYIDNSGNEVSAKEKAAKYTFGKWTKEYVRLFSDGEDKESGLKKNAEVFIKAGSATGTENQGVWTNCSTAVLRSYTVQAQGSSDLKFRNTDNAGNKKESKYVNVKIDRTGPTYKMNTTINSDGSMTITASNIKDTYSGVKEYKKNVLCQYQTYNGTSWGSWTNCSTSNSAKISVSSIKKVKFRAQDNVGNTTEKEEEVDIDMDAPTLKVTAGRCSDSSSSTKCANSNFKGSTQVQTAKGNTKNITFTTWSLDGLKLNYEVTEENIKEIKWEWNESNIFDKLDTTLADNRKSTTTTKKGTKTLTGPGRRYGVISATDKNGKISRVNITVYISISIEVTFNKNDGTTKPATATQNFNYGTKNQKFEKTFTRTGYTLSGWSKTKTSTTNEYEIANPVSDTWILNNKPSITLYAVWIANKYNVLYSANGGSGAPSTQQKSHNVTLKLSTTKPIRKNYTFAGWKSTDKTMYSPGGNYTKNEKTTMTAQWCQNCAATGQAVCSLSAKDGKCTYTTSCPSGYTISNNGKYNPSCTAIKYAVSYSANGGTGAPSTQQKSHNVTLKLSTTKPIRKNYTFAGWKSTDKTMYSPGGNYTKNEKTTMTAQWCQNCAATGGASCSLSAKDGKCTYTTSCPSGYTISNNGKYNPSCKKNKPTVEVGPAVTKRYCTMHNGGVTYNGSKDESGNKYASHGSSVISCGSNVANNKSNCCYSGNKCTYSSWSKNGSKTYASIVITSVSWSEEGNDLIVTVNASIDSGHVGSWDHWDSTRYGCLKKDNLKFVGTCSTAEKSLDVYNWGYKNGNEGVNTQNTFTQKFRIKNYASNKGSYSYKLYKSGYETQCVNDIDAQIFSFQTGGIIVIK